MPRKKDGDAGNQANLESASDQQEQVESISEKELTGEKIPRLFPIRLGFFSLIFLAFFTISVAILNIAEAVGIVGGSGSGGGDLYQIILDWLRNAITIPVASDIYQFIVRPLEGAEALYISSGFVLTFFLVSILSTRKRVVRTIFSGNPIKRILLQFLLFITIFTALMYFMRFFLIPLIGTYFTGIEENQVHIYVLIAGATTWIFFQGIALFTAARRSSTGFEARLTKRGSSGAYRFAASSPFLVILAMAALYLGYTIFITFVLLFLGQPDDPIWRTAVRWFTYAAVGLCVLPLFGLVFTRSKFRRQKAFDGLIVIGTNLFMYPYLLFNSTIYFLLPKARMSGGSGTGDSTFIGQIFMWVDLAVTLTLLIMAMRTVGKRTGYRFGKLEKHAFIMFIYAALAGQFGIRYQQTRGGEFLNLGGLETIFLDGQYIMVNIFVLAALFFSVLAFSSKKFGLYFRVHEQVSKADGKRLAYIYDFLKQEFVRNEAPLVATTMYDPIATIMKIDKFEVMQLLEKTRRRYPDMNIEGVKKRYIHFT
nr:hypothetical protein [Candidatus Sigynarchaeota archaeon]